MGVLLEGLVVGCDLVAKGLQCFKTFFLNGMAMDAAIAKTPNVDGVLPEVLDDEFKPVLSPCCAKRSDRSE